MYGKHSIEEKLFQHICRAINLLPTFNWISDNYLRCKNTTEWVSLRLVKFPFRRLTTPYLWQNVRQNVTCTCTPRFFPFGQFLLPPSWTLVSFRDSALSSLCRWSRLACERALARNFARNLKFLALFLPREAIPTFSLMFLCLSQNFSVQLFLFFKIPIWNNYHCEGN